MRRIVATRKVENKMENIWLETMLGEQSGRIKGIKCWEDIENIGSNSIERLIQLSQETILKQMTQGADKDELKSIRKAIDYLEQLKSKQCVKPLLPRLRNENLNNGDKVYIYLGDTKTSIAQQNWVKGLIIDKQKSFNNQWVDGTPNSGYFWLLTVKTEQDVFPRENTLKFSTSEPRVLHEWELIYLKNNFEIDKKFLDIFSTNANRDWLPIWCIEKSLTIDFPMDMKSWILAGTCHL
jgi:hypothetical protein